MADQKIRIRVKSYDHKLLDDATNKIVDTAVRAGAKISGPIPLPIRRSLYCVLKSPHTDKKSREHFEFKTHKRLVDILESSPRVIEALTNIELPAGVDIEVKL